MLAGLQRCYETQCVCFWVVFFVLLSFWIETLTHSERHRLISTPHSRWNVWSEPSGTDFTHISKRVSARTCQKPARTPFAVRGYDRLVHLVRFVPQHVNTKCNQSSQNRPDGATNVSNHIWSHQLHNMNNFKLPVNSQALKRIVCYETYP